MMQDEYLTPPSKRFLDIVLSLIVILFLWPLFLIIAIAIKLDSDGPIIFQAQRIGKDGKPFTMYKFRTMIKNAQAILPELQEKNLGGEHLIRISNDPRVTRIGRLLRKSLLDELPQFINILKGDMSIVGPRPQAPNEVALYDEYQKRRLQVLPGLTGLWQVTSRGNPLFDEWVRLDLQYIDNWSIWVDLKIILKTILYMLRMEEV